jgi:hypothetical protein
MAKFKKGKEFEKAPAGNHPAVCVGVWDIGTQEVEFEGKKKETPQLIVQHQLVEERTSEGENMCIHGTYYFGASAKSNLGKLLKPWYGVSDPETIDPATMLLRPSMLTVVQGVSKKGKAFSNIEALSMPPKGLKIAKSTEPATSFFFDFEEDEEGNEIPESVTFNEDDFKAVPDWVKKKIVASKEYPIALANNENGGWVNPAKGKNKKAAPAKKGAKK